MAIVQNVPTRLGLKVLFAQLFSRLMPVLVIFFLTSLIGILLLRFDSFVQSLSLSPEIYRALLGLLSALFLIGVVSIFVFGFFIALATILSYYFYFYTIGDFSFQIRQGIFERQDTSISYRQIRNVDISQPFLYNILGIAFVEIFTLSNASDAVDPNTALDMKIMLDWHLAQELQDYLIKKSNVGEVIEFPGGGQATISRIQGQ